MTKVKICGITNLKDAEAAIRFGADALGFIFAESKRQIDPNSARDIIARVGPFVTIVGVFVNYTAAKILDIASSCRLDAIQLHGEESVEQCKRLAPYKVIKTFRVGELFSITESKKYPCDALLFETPGETYGGTGKTWAWEKLPVRKITKPFIVSGGLTPHNVERAVKTLRPYAVDTASGVESKAGYKDHELMKRFIQNAKHA